jgi:hypothetical protein
LNHRLKANIGTPGMTNGEYYAAVAEESGVTVKRVLELEELQRQWPSEGKAL